MEIHCRSLVMTHLSQSFKKFLETIDQKQTFFVDFDETLVSTNKINNFDEELNDLLEDENVSKYIFNHKGQNMVSFLRPHAIEFLTELKKLGKVYILTAADKEFQLPIKNYFKIPINDNDVFGISEYSHVPYHRNSYLIDNLDFHQSDIIDKLTAMGHPPEYSEKDYDYVENDRHIKVKPFHFHHVHTDRELINLLNFIKQL